MIAPLLDAAVVLVVCVDLDVVRRVRPGSGPHRASSPARRCTRSSGTSCWPRATRATAVSSPRWRWPRNRASEELLGIPDSYAVAALLPLGKPLRQVTKLTRKPVSEFVTRERFDGESR